MRAVVLVIDSFGVGALPDAEDYGDEGANTALHICETVGKNLQGDLWPNLKSLGLGNAARILGFELPGCEAVEKPLASFGVMEEKSPGKDTTTGHWELAGVELENSFTTFPKDYPSFPAELVSEFSGRINRGTLGNKAASGTVIIEELGGEHLESGKPIIYTSSDSVFQIAAHDEVVSIEGLYGMCEIARELCNPYQIGRVIARPFTGKPGAFTRTKARKDYSISLPETSLLDYMLEHGIRTIGVGKIGDIFNEQGLSESYHDKGNHACIERTIDLINQGPKGENGFIFVNLVDTDMHFGHRRDAPGYAAAVSEIDKRLPEIMDLLDKGDLLIVTADHGCDPTFKGSDHTREYVPLLVYQKDKAGKSLGIRKQFSDLARSLSDFFVLPPFKRGISFYA